jgi:hypothetical protein
MTSMRSYLPPEKQVVLASHQNMYGEVNASTEPSSEVFWVFDNVGRRDSVCCCGTTNHNLLAHSHI